jgi:hypothetical protein
VEAVVLEILAVEALGSVNQEAASRSEHRQTSKVLKARITKAREPLEMLEDLGLDSGLEVRLRVLRRQLLQVVGLDSALEEEQVSVLNLKRILLQTQLLLLLLILLARVSGLGIMRLRQLRAISLDQLQLRLHPLNLKPQQPLLRLCLELLLLLRVVRRRNRHCLDRLRLRLLHYSSLLVRDCLDPRPQSRKLFSLCTNLWKIIIYHKINILNTYNIYVCCGNQCGSTLWKRRRVFIARTNCWRRTLVWRFNRACSTRRRVFAWRSKLSETRNDWILVGRCSGGFEYGWILFGRSTDFHGSCDFRFSDCSYSCWYIFLDFFL